jgi:hypothetical protein
MNGWSPSAVNGWSPGSGFYRTLDETHQFRFAESAGKARELIAAHLGKFLSHVLGEILYGFVLILHLLAHWGLGVIEPALNDLRMRNPRCHQITPLGATSA